ncbi:MAG: sigma-E factor regulatory protein RseB domain-containing protein [Armatimonadota bacterium]|nr:sigma-E factor regulatory protein RseB domain-containing protein [Armatimonadota bacterium]MDR7450464.1 sigma-E factor regulatory protein RseB domain-containing protein [Armatimonadota bacterium]MDR7466953.1 sigma-E factor regulatory protein RseB domain-containing protein [Armatimonadota bacterium]MDR7493505.1 sigma-E factor regulatory protein RseB domain-containing protein [Armatimonadota bacterium]MDR7498770.1 sigma-E factor regulatory protein RseB domain-containing protein [Armatimonadota
MTPPRRPVARGALILALVLSLTAAWGSPSPAAAPASPPPPAAAEPTFPDRASLPPAREVLRLMLAAPAIVDYEGTKIISTVRGARAETVTILEAYKRLGRLRLEFLSPESVSGRLVVDDGLSAWQYEPALHLVIRGPSFVQGRARPERADEILRRYRVAVVGREAVIGRDTVVLALAPGATGSDRRLWVDEGTGVILRAEERDASGEIVYTSYFSRISYSINLPVPLFRFRQPAGAKVLNIFVSGDPVASAEDLRARAGKGVVIPSRLLQFAFRDGRVARHGALAAVALSYTDGVGGVVTLFQTPTARMAFPTVGRAIPLGGGRGRILDVGYFRVLLWQSQGMNFALLGNVPVAALVAMAAQIAPPR